MRKEDLKALEKSQPTLETELTLRRILECCPSRKLKPLEAAALFGIPTNRARVITRSLYPNAGKNARIIVYSEFDKFIKDRC